MGKPCTKQLSGPRAYRLQSTTLAGADWQSSAPPSPHLPMAMHSCRIWPKGRRRLNWSCPSKERESYQGNGAKEERQREEGEGDSRPFPVPASGRRGYHPPSGVTQPAPALHHTAWPTGPTHPGNCRRDPRCSCCQPDPRWTRNSCLQNGKW